MGRKAKYTVEEQREMYEEMSNQHNNPLLKNARIDLQFKHDNQKTFAELINSKEIILCSGPAGGGKTYVASAMALKLVKDHPLKYKKIYLIKSVTTLKDEEIGFLKGTMEEKMEPFVFSFIHNLEKIVGKSIIESMRGRHEIEVMPLAYTRGISLDNAIVLIDETQNLTKDHLVTLMTRIGTNCKLILMGDTDQVDRKIKSESGMKWIISKLENIDGVGIVNFTLADVVRNPIISKILEAVKE